MAVREDKYYRYELGFNIYFGAYLRRVLYGYFGGRDCNVAIFKKGILGI